MTTTRKTRRTERISLEQGMGYLYNVFGSNIMVTFRVSKQSISLIKVTSQKYAEGDEDEEDTTGEPEDIMEPRSWGGTHSKMFKPTRPHYVG